MARYSAFLGHRVEVHYRAGDILLPASGTLVADSGRSIFLEQHILQHGQQKHFRWEIPYQYIVRLAEITGPEAAEPAGEPARQAKASIRDPSPSASGASAGTPAMLPLRNRPKTA
jgi:hypothetical protein